MFSQDADFTSWEKIKNKSECDITQSSVEKELCYPKSDTSNNPFTEKLFNYRKSRGSDCSPTLSDPCIIDHSGLVLPKGTPIPVDTSIQFDYVENEDYYVSCESLLGDNYSTYKNDYKGIDHTITIERGTFVRYFPKNSPDEELAAREEVELLAKTQALTQLTCKVTSPEITFSCINKNNQLITTRDTSITIKQGEFTASLSETDLKNPNTDQHWKEQAYSNIKLWEAKYKSIEDQAKSLAATSLTCTYGNVERTAYCVYPVTKTQDNQLVLHGLSPDETPVELDDNFTIGSNAERILKYEFDENGNLTIKLSSDTEGSYFNTLTPYQVSINPSDLKFKSDTNIYKGDGGKTYDISLFYPGGETEITIPAGTITKDFTYDDFNKLTQKDQEKEITSLNDQAYTLAESQLYCQYGNPFYADSCPEGTSLSGGSLCAMDSENYHSCVSENTITSSQSTYDALTSAKTIVDSQLQGCLIQNVEVKAFCDKLSMFKQMLEDGIYDVMNNKNIIHASSDGIYSCNGEEVTDWTTFASTIYLYKENFVKESKPVGEFDNQAEGDDINNPESFPTLSADSYYCFQAYDKEKSLTEKYKIDNLIKVVDINNVYSNKDKSVIYICVDLLSPIETDEATIINQYLWFIYDQVYDQESDKTSYNLNSYLISETLPIRDEELSDTEEELFKLENTTLIPIECMQHCIALDSISYTTVPAGTYSGSDSANLADYNQNAVNLASTSISCLYGNAEGGPLKCSEAAKGNNLTYFYKEIGNPMCTECAMAQDSTTMTANIFLAETPWNADLQALTVMLASRICIPRDRVGSGGGGSSVELNMEGKVQCDSCSEGCCVFCDE